MKWLKEKIYGSHDKEIKRLKACMDRKDDVISTLEDANSAAGVRNGRLLERNAILETSTEEMVEAIRKIERGVQPAKWDDSYHREIKLALHVVDRPHLDIVVATMPLNLMECDPNETVSGSYSTKRIEIDARISCFYEIEEEFFEEASHALQVTIARRCAEVVEHKLLASQGWRCDKDFNDLLMKG